MRFGLLLLAVAVVAIAVLAPALGGPFLWDDVLLIPNNASVQSLANWQDWFRTPLFQEILGGGGAARYFRPLPILAFALEWRFAGPNPALFHATNLILYLLLVLLLGGTLRRYTTPTASLVITLLFALHPTHAECAAWISGRMDVLLAIFVLATLWAIDARLRGAPLAALFEISFAALAYMSKETALLLPAFACVEIWRARGAHHPLKTGRQIARALLPQATLAAIYGITRWLWFPLGATSVPMQGDLRWTTRLALALETLGRNVSLTVWPYPQRAQHGLIDLDTTGTPVWHATYVVLGLVVGAATLWFLVAQRRHASRLLAIGLVLATLVPSLNLISPWLLACLTYERYLLLPHVALCLCLAVAMNSAAPSKLSGRARGVLAVAGLMVLTSSAWRMHIRSLDYADARRFWRHELAVNPQSSIAPWSLAELSRRPRDRLNWLRLCHVNASRRGQYRDADDCQLSLTEALHVSLLDSHVSELEHLADAWSATLALTTPPPGGATHFVRGIPCELPRVTARRERLRRAYPGRVESNLAILKSRVGLHESALRFAEFSLAQCRDCRWSFPLATVYAAAGDYRRAFELVRPRIPGPPEADRVREQVMLAAEYHSIAAQSQGAKRLHAEAQSLLYLGRFGLAFALLHPVEAAIVEAIESADDYALIAYRAGYVEDARRALERHRSRAAVDRILSIWAEQQPALE